MHENFKASLWVNKQSVELNQFAEQVLARTMAGAVSSLKGAEDMHSLELRLDKGDLCVDVNYKEITLSPFPNEVITATVVALVSALKGVDKTENLRIVIDID